MLIIEPEKVFSEKTIVAFTKNTIFILDFCIYDCLVSCFSLECLDLNQVQIISKVKSCYNPLRLGTVIVLVSSGIDFVNTPRLYSDRATR